MSNIQNDNYSEKTSEILEELIADGKKKEAKELLAHAQEYGFLMSRTI